LIHVCKVSTYFGEGHAFFFASLAALVSHHACGVIYVTNERETVFPCETLPALPVLSPADGGIEGWSSLQMAALWLKLLSFCVKSRARVFPGGPCPSLRAWSRRRR